MSELQAQRDSLEQAGAALLIVGTSENLAGNALAEHAVVEGAEEILATYRLLRRTLGNADMRDADAGAAHIEFLIDKYGYVRARWLPSENARGWRDWQRLREQIVMLAEEAPMLPPPDDHVH
jgi:putative copper resistance protein D